MVVDSGGEGLESAGAWPEADSRGGATAFERIAERAEPAEIHPADDQSLLATVNRRAAVAGGRCSACVALWTMPSRAARASATA